MLSDGNSTYHGVQLTLNKKLTRGLTVLAYYTWSKMLDNGSGDGAAPANPFNLRAEKGRANEDIPQHFVASFIWEMGSPRNQNRSVREIAGGWKINGIVALQSAPPFGVTAGRDHSGSAVNRDRADVAGDWRLPGERSKNAIIQQYFNTAAFVANAP